MIEKDYLNNLNCMIDLHLHLDGAISLESAKQLAKMQGIQIPETDEGLLKKMRVSKDCSDLNEFLEMFEFPCLLLQTKEGIKQAMINLLSELKEQGVMYSEIRFAPQKSTDKGLSQDEVVEAALDGIKASGCDAGLILCCMRGNDNHEQNIDTILTAEKYYGKGVVAVDLAGAEALFPTSDFDDIFALAKEKNLPFTIHAGEACGPESVKAALKIGACRIGHGVQSLKDRALVKELAESQIPLELCPTSNVCTAIVSKISEWPFKELFDSGMCLTINTDDPSIEGVTIKEEFNKLIETFDIGKQEIKQLLINSVNASFANHDLKQKMISRIECEL